MLKKDETLQNAELCQMETFKVGVCYDLWINFQRKLKLPNNGLKQRSKLYRKYYEMLKD